MPLPISDFFLGCFGAHDSPPCLLMEGNHKTSYAGFGRCGRIDAYENATLEMIGNAKVLDVRSEVSVNAEFYRTVSDHLPIIVRMRSSEPDDD